MGLSDVSHKQYASELLIVLAILNELMLISNLWLLIADLCRALMLSYYCYIAESAVSVIGFWLHLLISIGCSILDSLYGYTIERSRGGMHSEKDISTRFNHDKRSIRGRASRWICVFAVDNLGNIWQRRWKFRWFTRKMGVSAKLSRIRKTRLRLHLGYRLVHTFPAMADRRQPQKRSRRQNCFS